MSEAPPFLSDDELVDEVCLRLVDERPRDRLKTLAAHGFRNAAYHLGFKTVGELRAWYSVNGPAPILREPNIGKRSFEIIEAVFSLQRGAMVKPSDRLLLAVARAVAYDFRTRGPLDAEAARLTRELTDALRPFEKEGRA